MLRMERVSTDINYKGFCIKEGFLVQKNDKDEIVAISSGWRIGEPTVSICIYKLINKTWFPEWKDVKPFKDFFVTDDKGRDITEDYKYGRPFEYSGDRFNPKEGDVRENPIMFFEKNTPGQPYRYTGREIFMAGQWMPECEIVVSRVE